MGANKVGAECYWPVFRLPYELHLHLQSAFLQSSSTQSLLDSKFRTGSCCKKILFKFPIVRISLLAQHASQRKGSHQSKKVTKLRTLSVPALAPPPPRIYGHLWGSFF